MKQNKVLQSSKPEVYTLSVKRYAHTQKEKCVTCGICANVCPVNAIQIEGYIVDGLPQLARLDVDMNRCLHCDLCVQSCPVDALEFTVETPCEVSPTSEKNVRT